VEPPTIHESKKLLLTHPRYILSPMVHVGIGYDVHAFASGRKLILGGVEIPHRQGLAGHSDADVLMHAICDALLGAIGEADIGSFFPDTDGRWRNASIRSFWKRRRNWWLDGAEKLLMSMRRLLPKGPG